MPATLFCHVRIHARCQHDREMRTAARRPVRGAAEGSKAKALPLDQVLQRIQRADGLDRAVVAALISHLHASDLARSISLYTSTNTKASEAGLAWAAKDANRYPIEAGIVRVAKQAANAVLTALQTLLDAPQGALRDELALFILLDCFRVAMATLIKAQGSTEQLGAVGLSVARKLIALEKVGGLAHSVLGSAHGTRGGCGLCRRVRHGKRDGADTAASRRPHAYNPCRPDGRPRRCARPLGARHTGACCPRRAGASG